MRSRRSVLALAGAGLASWVGASHAAGLVADDGSPMRSMDAGVAPVASAAALAQRYEAETPDAVLVEWSDYNCGYCRRAAQPLAELLSADRKLALHLVQLPILSRASEEAAAVQHAIYRRAGAEAGARLHLALMGAAGRVDAARALAACAQFGWEPPNAAEIGAALAEIAAGRAAAARLGVRYTPTFAMAGTLFIGWPGPRTIADMAAQARRCGRLTCD